MVDGTLAISSSVSSAASAVKQKIKTGCAASLARYEAKPFGRILGGIGAVAEYVAKFVGKVFIVVSGALIEGTIHLAFLEAGESLDNMPVWYIVSASGFFYWCFKRLPSFPV